MIERKEFQTAMITLRWGRQTVGFVTIGRPEASIESATSNQSATSIEPLVTASSITGRSSNNSNDVSATDFVATFSHIGPSLLSNNILMMILYGLTYAAHFPKTFQLDKVELSLPAPYNMSLVIVDPDAESRAESPFLEPRWIIMALSQIPQFLTQARKWTAVEIRMMVGDDFIGHGVINRGGDSPSPAVTAS